MKPSFLLALRVLSSVFCHAASKPNIVFIFADDWGWGDLSCHGHPWLKTPNLDRLASEGTGFQQFKMLNPVCSPSRTAAMTGIYPARFCIHQHFAPNVNVERGRPDWLDPKAPTIARFMKNAGYRTGRFGKWHLTNTGAPGAPQPAEYDFDESAVFNGPGDVKSQAKTDATADNAVHFIRESKGRVFYLCIHPRPFAGTARIRAFRRSEGKTQHHLHPHRRSRLRRHRLLRRDEGEGGGPGQQRRAGAQGNAAPPRPELFNVAADLTRTNNLAAKEPARVKDMSARLERIRQQGHSRAGAATTE